MLELNIKGNTVQELYANASAAFLLLAQGGQTMFAPQQPAAPTENNVAATPGVQTAEPVGDVTKLPDKLETARKSTRKPPVTIDVKPIPEGGDAVPDMTGKAAKVEAPKLTLEDCRARTKEVIKKHEKDAYEALKIPRDQATQEQKDAVMAGTMKFMMDLFKPFNIKKAPDLKPEQFAEYMAVTEKFV